MNKYKTRTLFLVITDEMYQDLKNMNIDIDFTMRNALLNVIEIFNGKMDE